MEEEILDWFVQKISTTYIKVEKKNSNTILKKEKNRVNVVIKDLKSSPKLK